VMTTLRMSLAYPKDFQPSSSSVEALLAYVWSEAEPLRRDVALLRLQLDASLV
jgi:hypothetical protein